MSFSFRCENFLHVSSSAAFYTFVHAAASRQAMSEDFLKFFDDPAFGHAEAERLTMKRRQDGCAR
jgi:hypothetical protein